MEIKDSGCGIATSDLQNIFDPFFSTKASGSGLGLAVVHSVVQSHGGLVTVESSEEGGTTFTVYLPAGVGKAVPEKPAGIPTHGAGERILVLEDDLTVGRLYRSLLLSLGYQVDLVMRGEDAEAHYIKAYRTDKPYDAVILDLTIRGGRGGRETLEALRRFDPTVAAVLASGYHNDAAMSAYAEHGFAACLPKPFRASDLSAVLRQVLDRAPQAD